MGTQSSPISHFPVSLPGFAEPHLSIDSPSVRPLPGDPSSGATSHIGEIAQGGHKKQNNVLAQDETRSYRPATTIDMLPDDVFHEIFDFYRNDHDYVRRTVWKWHLLVHVCQRWRQIIFGSPHRLNLQIPCTYDTPFRKYLDIWPAYPIAIDFYLKNPGMTSDDEDSIIAALEHPDRVSDVKLHSLSGSELGRTATAMQKPFPVLKRLSIFSWKWGRHAPDLSTDFLGRSVPCLQEITLHGIPFPELPMLLPSASDLVKLDLYNIPPTGYISPEAMVTCLATLPKLEFFIIGFKLVTSRPDQIQPPPRTRTVLPALTSFQFTGASEYLEDLVARIDGPILNDILVVYLNQLVDFQVVQLSEFIDRSVGLEITLCKHAQFSFSDDSVAFTRYRHASHTSPTWDRRPTMTIISCKGIDWQVLHIIQVLSQISATLSNVVHLKLKAENEGQELEGSGDVEWLDLLHQFSAAQTLHVSRDLAGHVALALEDITGEMAAEELPSLNLICLAGQQASSIEKFLAIRRLSGLPVTVVDTETEFDERLDSYVSE